LTRVFEFSTVFGPKSTGNSLLQAEKHGNKMYFSVKTEKTQANPSYLKNPRKKPRQSEKPKNPRLDRKTQGVATLLPTVRTLKPTTPIKPKNL